MLRPSSRPLVMKFGGSSVADAAGMREAGALVVAALGQAPLVVVSAMGKTTDALFELARRAVHAAAAADVDAVTDAIAADARALVDRHREQALQLLAKPLRAATLPPGTPPPGALPAAPPPVELEGFLTARTHELELQLRAVAHRRALSPEAMDAIAAHGERMATAILAAHLRAQGIDVELFDARRALRTDARHGGARPNPTATRTLCAEHLLPRLRPEHAVLTEGYIGSTAAGTTTTLGRGGSDYSAALFGAALDAREVQVWTDVEGVLTADPRLVPEARTIGELTFAEAAELAAFGAKFLHPATVQPVAERRVPVTVRHTRRPHAGFTRISHAAHAGEPVTAIAARGPVTLLTVPLPRTPPAPGDPAPVFEVFTRAQVRVDLVARDAGSVTLAVAGDAPLEDLVREIETFGAVTVARDRAVVALIGARLTQAPALVTQARAALEDLDAEFPSTRTEGLSLGLVVAHAAMPQALRRLHHALLGGRAATPRPPDPERVP